MRTAEEVTQALTALGCAVLEDGGQFVLVHPAGYGGSKSAHELVAKERNPALAEAWNFLHPEAQAYARVATIKRVVAEGYGEPPSAFLRRDRNEPLATARRIAMALCRDLTAASLETLGRSFERDRTDIRYAQASVAEQCAVDRQFAARVGLLREACLRAFVPTKPTL